MKAGDVRMEVFQRDNFRCIALQVDEEAGPCYDKFGHWFSGYDPNGINLEADRIPPEPGSREASHLLVNTMVTLCPSHHRGTGPVAGYVWATAHRPELREWLAKHAR